MCTVQDDGDERKAALEVLVKVSHSITTNKY